MKAILRFIIIALVATLGLAMIGALYLFFIPKATLFGIDYISLNYIENSKAYASENIDTIEMTSHGYKVTVVPTKSENIYAKVYANSIGFVKKKNNTVKFNTEVAGGVVKLNISEPHGVTWKNNSYIELHVPQNKAFNFVLNNKSAKTYMSDANLKANKLTYKTSSGNMYLSNLAINNDIDLNLAKAKCYIEDSVKLNNNNINLSFTSGDLIAKNMKFGSVAIIQNKGGTIEINSCNSIISKVNAGGRYTIGTAGIVNVVSEDTNINIGTITTGCSIDLTKSGKVEITNINCAAASIETNTGDIKIENANESISLKSDEGDIVVKNATKFVTIVNKYGNIDVSYKTDIGNYDTTNKYRSADITNYNGKVSVKGIENIKLNITNKGRANIEMRNVLGQNTISGNLGDMHVVINKDAAFDMSVSGTTGEVRVNFLELEESGGYTEHNIPPIVKINGGNADNTLTITGKKGDIKVVDTVLAG